MGWRNGDEIRKLLIESKGLVLPSLAEGLPVVIMEAMSVGRPAISTYVGAYLN
jgi:glycosyltransferase involved in cell wall biosynthesis